MSEFSGSTSSNNPTTNQTPKMFSTYVPPAKSFQPYTIPSHSPISQNPSKLSDVKKDDGKPRRLPNSPTNAGQIMQSHGFKAEGNYKPMPNFLENRSALMKGSMMSADEGSTRSAKVETQQQLQNLQAEGSSPVNRKQARLAENQDMKYSSIELGSEGAKTPYFINQKSKQRKLQQANGMERPDYIKQSLAVKNIGGDLLKSSQALQKKTNFQIQLKEQESKKEVNEWKSGNSSVYKKKQKVFSVNDFQIIKELGAGKYGKVFLVFQKQTNFICALKILQKQLILKQQIVQQIIRQLKIQSFLNHNNIIKLYGFFQDPKNIYILMQPATGGQLYKQIKKHVSMPQTKVASIMRQVCSAVNQLHSNHIIHRDIKPQNIVIHQGILKLCDFGWSVYSDTNMRTTFCGTPLYVGPEILKGKEYGDKIDIWSLGVMMYEMMVGENPFKIARDEDLIKIVKDEIKIPNYVELSAQAQDFLLSCLEKNPQLRISIRQILHHDFFKKYPEKGDKLGS